MTKKVDIRRVKIFKIRNRRGYACLCLNHLTEGRTPYEAYRRMVKALRRSGFFLKNISAKETAKLIAFI